MKKILSLGLMLGCYSILWGQDSLRNITMEGVTLSVSKWGQNINEVPNKITKISRNQVLLLNPQTSADMLGQTGSVFIQKSQLGGGSPMIRGFATNRVLLVVDGVRMNNAIYRSGNLQNVISIDPFSLETTEVIFGPGSLIYGSDAIGGVMDFHTLQPLLAQDSKLLVKGSAVARYASANREKTGHMDLNIGGKRFSFLASYTHSDFDDLKMGKHGRDQNYLRPEYVIRENNADIIVANRDPRVQRFSGYSQDNFLGKLRFRATEFLDLEYAYNYARTGDAPRYDRLTQYRNGALRFAEWYYGPMLWKQHSVTANFTKKTAIADKAKLVAGFQDYAESRNDRSRNNNNRTTQAETVKAYTVNLDALKKAGGGELFYGLEYVFNKVGSTGQVTNISTGSVTPFTSRYPDGSTWSTMGIYASYKQNITERLTLTGGARYSINTLDASFDTTFIKFPYREARLNEGALTGNAGLVYRAGKGWQLNANISTGYRMPNVDDIGKLFESAPGNVTVPNPALQPEYALNFEAGVVKHIPNKLKLELNGFHTILNDAIVRRPFTMNGADSIDFGGIRSRVEALQNVAKATVWGVQASFRIYASQRLYLQTHANWIWGKETDDAKNEQVPLRHAPPFYGSTQLVYRHGKLQAEISAQYNSEVSNKDLAPSEQSKTDMYAVDADGKPFAPSWYTVNLKSSYQLLAHLTVTAGWENITNQRYRPYSSGIVAAGSNLIISLRASL